MAYLSSSLGGLGANLSRERRIARAQLGSFSCSAGRLGSLLAAGLLRLLSFALRRIFCSCGALALRKRCVQLRRGLLRRLQSCERGLALRGEGGDEFASSSASKTRIARNLSSCRSRKFGAGSCGRACLFHQRCFSLLKRLRQGVGLRRCRLCLRARFAQLALRTQIGQRPLPTNVPAATRVQCVYVSLLARQRQHGFGCRACSSEYALELSAADAAPWRRRVICRLVPCLCSIAGAIQLDATLVDVIHGGPLLIVHPEIDHLPKSRSANTFPCL